MRPETILGLGRNWNLPRLGPRILTLCGSLKESSDHQHVNGRFPRGALGRPGFREDPDLNLGKEGPSPHPRERGESCLRRSLYRPGRTVNPGELDEAERRLPTTEEGKRGVENVQTLWEGLSVVSPGPPAPASPPQLAPQPGPPAVLPGGAPRDS